jgi:hypothetical protein
MNKPSYRAANALLSVHEILGEARSSSWGDIQDVMKYQNLAGCMRTCSYPDGWDSEGICYTLAKRRGNQLEYYHLRSSALKGLGVGE